MGKVVRPVCKAIKCQATTHWGVWLLLPLKTMFFQLYLTFFLFNALGDKCPPLWLLRAFLKNAISPDLAALNGTLEEDLPYHRGCRLPSLRLSEPLFGMVIEHALKWDCKLFLDPPRALETTRHITFISLLNCKMILWLRPHFKWCVRRASELTHSTFNLTAVSPLGHSAALKKTIMKPNCSSRGRWRRIKCT